MWFDITFSVLALVLSLQIGIWLPLKWKALRNSGLNLGVLILGISVGSLSLGKYLEPKDGLMLSVTAATLAMTLNSSRSALISSFKWLSRGAALSAIVSIIPIALCIALFRPEASPWAWCGLIWLAIAVGVPLIPSNIKWLRSYTQMLPLEERESRNSNPPPIEVAHSVPIPLKSTLMKVSKSLSIILVGGCLLELILPSLVQWFIPGFGIMVLALIGSKKPRLTNTALIMGAVALWLHCASLGLDTSAFIPGVGIMFMELLVLVPLMSVLRAPWEFIPFLMLAAHGFPGAAIAIAILNGRQNITWAAAVSSPIVGSVAWVLGVLLS